MFSVVHSCLRVSLFVAFIHLFLSTLPFPLCIFLSFTPSSSASHSLWTWGEKDIVEYCFTLLRGGMKWECLSLLFLSLYLSWEDLPTRPESFPDHFTTAAQSTPLSSCFFVCLWTHRVSACLLAMKGVPRKTLPLIDCLPPFFLLSFSLLTLSCS